MATTRLSLPARKCFVREFRAVSALDNNTSIPNLHVWGFKNKQTFSVAWVQGKIVQASDGNDAFVLDDGTGHVSITGASSVPPGCPRPQQDKYMLVIGELMETTPVPVMKAMKLQDLTQDDMAQAMWELEVRDLQQYIT